MKGNRADDEARGIYHIAVGQDRGPTKSVSFEKFDLKGAATKAVMESTGVEALAAAYKANITMIGNGMFRPSNYLFVEPGSLGMDRGSAFRMGLGGYYTCDKITGKIDASGWETELDCIPNGATQGLAETYSKSATEPAQQTAYPKPGNNAEKK